MKELEGEKLGNCLNCMTGAGSTYFDKHGVYQIFTMYILTKDATDLVVTSNKQKRKYN